MFFDTLCRFCCKPRCRRLLGVNGKIVFFCSGRGPRQNDSMKLRKFRARPFRLNRFWRTSTTHYPAHQNVTFDQLWAGHHHPVLCSSTRGQGDSHPWGWGLLQKNICWIGNFRRSHQVGRRLTSSWHQKKQHEQQKFVEFRHKKVACRVYRFLTEWNLREVAAYWKEVRGIGKRFVECWAFGNWGNNQNMQVRWCDDMVIVPKWREFIIYSCRLTFQFSMVSSFPNFGSPFFATRFFFGNS